MPDLLLKLRTLPPYTAGRRGIFALAKMPALGGLSDRTRSIEVALNRIRTSTGDRNASIGETAGDA